MVDAKAILEAATDILVVDWPSRDVPEALARAGYTVIVKGGPAADDYVAYELREGAIAERRTGRAPDHSDLIYTYRPIGELPGIVAMARRLGATTIWLQSGVSSVGLKDPVGCWMSPDASREARGLVEAAGLRYLDDVYIADAARACARA